MNRSARGLLRIFVLVPVAAAATVLAAPAGAQSGPATAHPAPPAQGHRPAPTTEQYLLGKASGALNTVDRDLGATEGQVVEVLTADEAQPGASGAAKPPVPGVR